MYTDVDGDRITLCTEQDLCDMFAKAAGPVRVEICKRLLMDEESSMLLSKLVGVVVPMCMLSE